MMNSEPPLLKKEELPIEGVCFIVPVHPALFKAQISREIAMQQFKPAAAGLYDDLEQYIHNSSSGTERDWLQESFFGGKRHIDKDGNTTLWYPKVSFAENGLVRGFTIDGFACTCIHLSPYDGDRTVSLVEDDEWLLKMSAKKKRAYASEVHSGYGILKIYSQHNVDTYPQALMLRNWAIQYLNEALKSIVGK